MKLRRAFPVGDGAAPMAGGVSCPHELVPGWVAVLICSEVCVELMISLAMVPLWFSDNAKSGMQCEMRVRLGCRGIPTN